MPLPNNNVWRHCQQSLPNTNNNTNINHNNFNGNNHSTLTYDNDYYAHANSTTLLQQNQHFYHNPNSNNIHNIFEKQSIQYPFSRNNNVQTPQYGYTNPPRFSRSTSNMFYSNEIKINNPQQAAINDLVAKKELKTDLSVVYSNIKHMSDSLQLCATDNDEWALYYKKANYLFSLREIWRIYGWNPKFCQKFNWRQAGRIRLKHFFRQLNIKYSNHTRALIRIYPVWSEFKQWVNNTEGVQYGKKFCKTLPLFWKSKNGNTEPAHIEVQSVAEPLVVGDQSDSDQADQPVQRHKRARINILA